MCDRYSLGGVRRMSLLRWDKGGDSDPVTGVNWDTRLVGYRKIPAWLRAKLPRYWREGAVEVRPFPAETRLRASEAQGLSGEAVKGTPPTTVIPGVDESKSSPSNNRRLDRTHRRQNSSFLLVCNWERNLSWVVCQIKK